MIFILPPARHQKLFAGSGNGGTVAVGDKAAIRRALSIMSRFFFPAGLLGQERHSMNSSVDLRDRQGITAHQRYVIPFKFIGRVRADGKPGVLPPFFCSLYCCFVRFFFLYSCALSVLCLWNITTQNIRLYTLTAQFVLAFRINVFGDLCAIHNFRVWLIFAVDVPL